MDLKQHTNHLITETSPYLLQHAHNPVDWYPWGDEAFEKARTEDKPVFLSIGYSTCHWCHDKFYGFSTPSSIPPTIDSKTPPAELSSLYRVVSSSYSNHVSTVILLGGLELS